MANNKEVREEMIKKYGADDMIEECDIHYISQALRESMEGYRKSDDKLTYHHIIPQSKGGETTEENGAILKGYNHAWLEKLNKNDRDKINKELQEHKRLLIAKMENGKIKEAKACEFDMSDTMEIPLVPNEIEREEDER